MTSKFEFYHKKTKENETMVLLKVWDTFRYYTKERSTRFYVNAGLVNRIINMIQGDGQIFTYVTKTLKVN